jgi:hypothetical protein
MFKFDALNVLLRRTPRVVFYAATLSIAQSAQAAGTTPAKESFTATYRVQEQTVRVDFEDAANFRFVVNGGATVVRNGAMYVLLDRRGAPPVVLLVADRARANVRAGKVTAASSTPVGGGARAAVSPQPLNPASLAATTNWGKLSAALHESSFQRAGALRSTQIVTAKDGSFAFAQQIMRQTLASMDMSLCGSSVQNLVAWWVEEMTEIGHAVVSTSGGIALQSALTRLEMASNTWLPPEAAVEDYRIVATQK